MPNITFCTFFHVLQQIKIFRLYRYIIYRVSFVRESLYCCYNFLFCNEVSCLLWLLDVDILLKYVNFYVLFVCVCVCVFVGARGPMMKLKSCNIGVGMPRATGPRKKAARGKEELSQDTP